MFGFHNITVLVFTHSCQYICQLWRLDHQCHLRHLLRMCWWVWVWERTWKCLEEKKCVQKCDCCIFLNLSLGHARKYTGAKSTRACLDPPPTLPAYLCDATLQNDYLSQTDFAAEFLWKRDDFTKKGCWNRQSEWLKKEGEQLWILVEVQFRHCLCLHWKTPMEIGNWSDVR